MNKWVLAVFVMLGYDAGRLASVFDPPTFDAVVLGALATIATAGLALMIESRRRKAWIRSLRPEKRQ